ncbi:hypothetical protein RhiirB3_489013 [Rhizophagus irregularis]|nr:hypothetical protein RhiirB3_489013 [Rhizophagus irregularis]
MCLGEWRLFFIMSSISWALFFTSSLRECGLGLSSLCLGLLLIRSSFGPSLFRYVGWDSQKVEQDIRESFLKNKEGLHIPFLSNIKEFLDDNKSLVCPGEIDLLERICHYEYCNMQILSIEMRALKINLAIKEKLR